MTDTDTDTDADVFGPVDFVLLEFPEDKLTGEVADEVIRLAELGTIRLYDVMIIRKAPDGTYAGIAIDAFEGFSVLGGAQSGLVSDDDLAEAAGAMEPGTVAALLVYENAWAVPFVAAARRAGGQMIASARIPAQDVMDALEALEARG